MKRGKGKPGRRRGPFRPSRAELLAAVGKRVPDVIAAGLSVLFCGINPGLYSGAVGHHFARPGNRFWPALYESGFTPVLLTPWEEQRLLEWGCGITNLVNRTTATAAELTREELIAGGRQLLGKVRRYRPKWVAVLGIGAYRGAFHQPRALAGPQRDRLAGAGIWLLPNPSGLNANQQLPELVRRFRALRRASRGRAR